MMKVLVCDKLGTRGMGILREAAGIEVDEKLGLKQEDLIKVVGGFDAVIVRSATRITKEVLQATSRLKVVGRAGVGVDNVDLEEATKRGVIVMNTPEGNTISTCELTFSMMMALSRNLPQANAHVKAGGWDRGKFTGQELRGKNLGIVGFGRIGREVAKRALAFEMKVCVYDPFISKDVCDTIGVRPIEFEALCREADYITVHIPLSESTQYLLNAKSFGWMKPGVRIINCARGGIVHEADLAEAIISGKVKGAALDVFEEEPPKNSPLFALDNVIVTPHLGASTPEAQENVSVAVAEQVRDALLERGIRNAVNLPTMDEESARVLRPWVVLAEKLGAFLSELHEGRTRKVTIRYSGEFTQYKLAPLTLGVLKGFLTKALGSSINYVNAPLMAKERGIEVIETKTSQVADFANVIAVEVSDEKNKNFVVGTLFGNNDPRIVRINDYHVDAVPRGEMVLVANNDKPGVIGEVCILLGKNKINIAEMALGREEIGGRAITVFNVDQPVSVEVADMLRTLPNILSVKCIKL